jgi:hypothetical protein
MMHKQLWIGLLVGVIVYGASCASVQSEPLPANAQKTARIALVQEFVRELEVLYRLQETAKKEFAEDSSPSGKLMTSIRIGSRGILQMNESINRLSIINVGGQWAEFRDLLKQLHQQRIALMQEMNEIGKALPIGTRTGRQLRQADRTCTRTNGSSGRD